MDRETMLASNRSLAEESLTRRPRLYNGKIQLAEKYQELSNLATTCWEKQSQLGESTAAVLVWLVSALRRDGAAASLARRASDRVAVRFQGMMGKYMATQQRGALLSAELLQDVVVTSVKTRKEEYYTPPAASK